MTEPVSKNLLDIIDKSQWISLTKRFCDVLKINIFVCSLQGAPLLMVYQDKFGWDLLLHPSLNSNFYFNHRINIDSFHKNGRYREFYSPLDLHSFLIPIYIENSCPLAYLFAGPVLLNRRKTKAEYEQIAQDIPIDPERLNDAMNRIKSMSFIDLEAHLELLDEVFHHSLVLNNQKQELFKKRRKIDRYPLEILKASRDLRISHRQRFLESLLDIALHVTKAECGSVMMVDEVAKAMTVTLSKGMDEDVRKNTRLKVGEGIAGKAVQEDRSFILHGTQSSDNRIRPFLNRKDIKHAIITPIKSSGRILGVLNLHTKSSECVLGDQELLTIQKLSKLATASFDEF